MDESISEIEQLRDQLTQYQDSDPTEPEPAGMADGSVIMWDGTNSDKVSVDPNTIYSGNMRVAPLPPNPHTHTVSSMGPYSISNNAVGNIGTSHNDNIFNVNLRDPTDSIIRDMRTTVQERILGVKKELEDLSNKYEDKEQELHSLVQKVKELKTCVDALNPTMEDIFEEDIFEDNPF